MRVADHKGDSHCLAKRAPEAEHYAADHADTRIRQYDVTCDFPGRAAKAVSRFLEHWWHGLKHVSGYGSDERQDHNRENEARSENADSVRRPGEQGRQHWNIAEQTDEERLHVLLQERRENEQTPDSVDDTGNSGE